MPFIIDENSMKRMRRGLRARRLRIGPPKTKAERDLFNRMNALWGEVLFPASERIKEMIESNAPDYEIADVIEEALHEAQMKYNIASDDITWRWIASLDKDTRAAFHKGLRDSLGVDISAFVDTPEMQLVLQGATLEAAGLIRTIPRDYFGEVAQAVADNYTGRPLPEGRSLLQQIEHINGNNESRAKLIARDQSSKLIGRVNQARQQSIGVEMYRWRTIKDRRVVGNPGGLYPVGNQVHGNHYKMEGQICSWSDSTVLTRDGGATWVKRDDDMPKTHPGGDLQCRCHPEPIIDVKKVIKYAQQL